MRSHKPESPDLALAGTRCIMRGFARNRLPMRADKRGAVAQLGERCVRNAEVEGSIPFRSTNKINKLRAMRCYSHPCTSERKSTLSPKRNWTREREVVIEVYNCTWFN